MLDDFFDGGVQTAVMKRLATRKISGGAFRKLRNRLALTQAEMGQKLGLTPTRIAHIEAAIEVGVYPRVWRALAELTKKTVPEVEAILAIPSDEDDEMLDANVVPYTEKEIPEIPLFELPIAAGVLTPLPDVEEYDEMQQIAMKLKRYRVRIRGDSMEEEYADGCIVEFVCLEWRQDGTVDGLELGRDYYVQTAEEMTFKRLKSISDHELVFVAVNKRKFPKEIRVRREEVNRMARAIGIFSPK